MPQTMADPGAVAAVVQRIFMEKFRQSIACGLGHQVNAKIAGHALAVSADATAPFRRRAVGLLDSAGEGSANKRIGPNRIEQVVAQLFLLRRALVSLAWLSPGHVRGHHAGRAGLRRRGRLLLRWRRILARARSRTGLRSRGLRENSKS